MRKSTSGTRRFRGFAIAAAATLVACAQPATQRSERAESEPRPLSKPTEAERPIGKPVAAVKPILSEEMLDGHRRRITVSGTPTANADALELRIDVRGGQAVVSGPTSRQFGPTPAGTHRELVADVTLVDGQRTLIFGNAAITIGGNTRTASADVVIVSGPAVPAGPPIRDIKLPDGTHVAETRETNQ